MASAEIPLPDEGCQQQLIPGQNGAFIQNPLHGFQFGFVTGFQRKHNALAAPVAPTEGKLHPLTGLQHHPIGDPVGIGLVNGEGRSGNGDFRDHVSPPS